MAASTVAVPLAMMPLLAIWLPKLSVPRVAPYLHSAAGLFQRELAPSTTMLCAINALSLLGIYVILQWMPAILHSSGVSPLAGNLRYQHVRLGNELQVRY